MFPIEKIAAALDRRSMTVKTALSELEDAGLIERRRSGFSKPHLCEAAAVVRRIFRMVIDGKGVYQIADILSEEKVLCPSAYLAAKGVGNRRNNKFEDPYRWWGTGEVFAGGSTRTIY